VRHADLAADGLHGTLTLTLAAALAQIGVDPQFLLAAVADGTVLVHNVRKIFIAETPLFEITAGSETFFAYNEFEKNDILAKLGSKKYTIQRSKGLGENDPEMMSRTTMCPQTRRLIAVTPADAEATARMFDVLLGDALADRKRFIADYGHLYIKDADI